MDLAGAAGPALLVVERPPAAELVFSSTAEVEGEELPGAEEVVARHQLWAVRTGRALRGWSASNRTRLRVRLADLGRTVEIGLAGPWLVGGETAEPEWAWQEAEVDGVAWDPLELPDLPILEPERLTRVPLHLEPTSTYRYRVETRQERGGRTCYRLRFAPRGDAPGAASGLAWLDTSTFALVELETVRSGLEGDVVAEERTVRYRPVGDPEDGRTPWLPASLDAFTRVSAFGATVSVEQRTVLAGHVLDPPDLEARRRELYASPLPMVRETAAGLRQLDPDGRGGRVLRAEPDRDQLFLVVGALAAEGLDFPVLPLGGVQYHDFDLAGRGSQLRVFFAGVLGDATWSDPDLLGPGAGVAATVRGQLLRFGDALYVGGEEDLSQRLQSRSQELELEASAALGPSLRVGLEATVEVTDFAAADDTEPGFVVPADGAEGRARLWAQASRGPFQASAWWEAGRRRGRPGKRRVGC